MDVKLQGIAAIRIVHLLRKTIAPIFLFLLLAPCLSATEVLERQINVRFQDTPLKEALAIIAQKGQFEWSYNARIIDSKKKVSLVTNNWTIRETLYELFGEGFTFKSNGNYLIIKRQRKPGNQIFGYVKDPVTGDRVANATVYDRKSLRATTTDENGYFKLKVPKATQIAISRLDYQDTVISISPKGPRLQKIELQAYSKEQARPFNLERSLDIAKTKAAQLFRISFNKWNDLNLHDSLHRRFQASVLPFIGTNHHLSAKVTNDWSLNMFAGISGGNTKLEVAGLGNFTRKDMTGVQVAGLFNELQGNSHGIQIGGLYNRTGDTLQGVQIGGLTNFAKNNTKKSVQVGGISNYTKSGTQLAQIGGILNKADQISGMQLAGITNYAAEIDGVQASGIFNHAKKVRGIQIGLINSAKEVHGLQIGLINRSGKRVVPFFNW